MLVRTGRGSSYTVDVSAGGFCTEVMRIYPVGHPIEGTIDTPAGPVTFCGEVAWSQGGLSRLALRGRMGVSFVQVDRTFATGLEPAPDPCAEAP
jgi:hypothetical protein